MTAKLRQIGSESGFTRLDAEKHWDGALQPSLASGTTLLFLLEGTAAASVGMREYRMAAPCLLVESDGGIIRHLVKSEDARLEAFALSEELSDSIFLDGHLRSEAGRAIEECPVFGVAGGEATLRTFCSLAESIAGNPDADARFEASRSLALTFFHGFIRGNRRNTAAPENAGSQEGPAAVETGMSLSSPKPERSNATDSARKRDLAAAFQDLVRLNYGRQRSVVWYAEEMQLTPKYLSQAVKDATGKPPLQWIDDCVAAESKALLKSTDFTIDQISVRLNFDSPALFGKFFRRMTGLSPRAYRKSRGTISE